MHGTRLRSFCGLITLVAALAASVAKAADPSAQEVFKRYSENAARLKTLHIQLIERQEFTEAFRESHRLRAEQHEGVIKAIEAAPDKPQVDLPPGVTMEQFLEQFRQQVSHSRAFMKNKEFENRYEFFIDGDDYQVRTLWTWIDKPPTGGWVFPTVPVTAKTLADEFKLCRIYSRSSLQQPAARIWPGKPNPESTVHPMISSEHVGKSQSLHFPPFTAFMYVDRHGGRHPIDSFFSVGEAALSVVRSEEVDGRKLLVVDAVIPTGQKSGIQNPDKSITYKEVHQHCRGWLDLERGALPVKLLLSSSLEGQDVTEAHWEQAGDIVTTKEIRPLENGAYYPAVTVCEHRQVSQKDLMLTQEQWAEVRAGKRQVTMETHDIRTWNCAIVSSTFPHDETFFVLDVQQGEGVYDLDAGKMIGALETQPAVAVGEPAPELKLARWLDGQNRTLADFRGKVVVIDFWGLWCGACRSSVPTKKLLQERFKDQPVVFISIHTAEKDPDKLAERISKFTADNGWNYLAAIDAGTMIENSASTHAYGVSGFPTEIILGKDGRVVHNSDIPPPGMEGIYGKSSDEITKADEAKIETWMKKSFEEAGEKYPLPEGLSQEEQLEIHQRVGLFQSVREVERARGN